MREPNDALESVNSRSQTVTPECISELRKDVQQIRSEIADEVMARRSTGNSTTYCTWDGQSPDGRKRKEYLHRNAKPFEGASDTRVRLADEIIRERQLEKVTAATRAIPRLMGMESGDDNMAGKSTSILKWLIRNRWGMEFRRQLMLLARWEEEDTPAAAIAWVDWVEEQALELRMITPLDLVQFYVDAIRSAGEEPTPEEAQAIIDMALPGGDLEALTAIVQKALPEIRPARAAAVARDLQKAQKAEVPVPYLRRNEPVVQALRLYEDVFLPANTVELQRASRIHLREWLHEAELRERQITRGYSKAWVDQVLDKALESSAFDSGTDTRVVTINGEINPRRGKYEVITTYQRAVNEDGILGIWVTVWNDAVTDLAAKPRKLFDRKHGKYPFVFFTSEILSTRLTDSRGVPELVQTEQMSVKLLRDSFEDHVQVATLPPLTVPPGSRFNIEYEPMGRIESGPRTPVTFMAPPNYPSAADAYWTRVDNAVARYFGRVHEAVPAAISQLHAQARVDQFLSSTSEVLGMVFQLVQQFMPDEQLQRIVGGNGMPVARSRDEIQGQYDVVLSFDVRDLDMELLLKKAKMMLDYVRPMDARARVHWDDIAARIVSAIDPTWGDQAVSSAESADQREANEEKAALVAMINGVRPPMPEGGINAQLRMDTLKADLAPRQSNPGAFAPLPPAAMMLIQERMQYLGFQLQQTQNAITGRTGVDVTKTDAQLQGADAAEVRQ